MIWKSRQMVRVLAKGGILTPSDMLQILAIVRTTGYKHVHFGSRQDMLFQVDGRNMDTVKRGFESIHTDYIIYGRKDSRAQNIVSSYAASDMTASTAWLSSGNYLNILEHFTFQPTLRINITDPKQSLVPLFYGQLNFIASSLKDYWYLYIRRDENRRPERWPVLVFCNDIGRLSDILQENWNLVESIKLSELFANIQSKLDYNWRNVETDLQLELAPPQDYEGFGKMYNSQNYWAGFYWRNNCYDVSFLEELCQLCLRTGISKICITPWKSILIKELREKDLVQWHRLLGRFGINMRHSSLELNWHLPLQDKRALKLKHFVVKEFNKVDVCVHGLTFGVRTKQEPAFCAILIERIPGIRLFNWLDLFVRYRLLHAKHFNANTCEYEEYMPQVPRYHLPEVLQGLTRKFYAQLYEIREKHSSPSKIEKRNEEMVFQCPHCFSIYSEKTGDILRGIPVNTPFALVPETYRCPLCDAPKKDFRAVMMSMLLKEAIV